ncbi:hypothetical protein B0H16DRAFT_1698151, partial [Mycena metata]
MDYGSKARRQGEFKMVVKRVPGTWRGVIPAPRGVWYLRPFGRGVLSRYSARLPQGRKKEDSIRKDLTAWRTRRLAPRVRWGLTPPCPARPSHPPRAPSSPTPHPAARPPPQRVTTKKRKSPDLAEAGMRKRSRVRCSGEPHTTPTTRKGKGKAASPPSAPSSSLSSSTSASASASPSVASASRSGSGSGSSSTPARLASSSEAQNPHTKIIDMARASVPRRMTRRTARQMQMQVQMYAGGTVGFFYSIFFSRSPVDACAHFPARVGVALSFLFSFIYLSSYRSRAVPFPLLYAFPTFPSNDSEYNHAQIN